MSCKKALVSAFSKVDGVVKSEVDCTKKTAVVTYNPKKTNVDAIIGALKGTKYTAAKKEG